MFLSLSAAGNKARHADRLVPSFKRVFILFIESDPEVGWGQAVDDVAATPPMKEGKNNSYRERKARTVYFIKYIFFLTDPSKSGIKTVQFQDLFLCKKNTRPNTLNKLLDGWYFLQCFLGKTCRKVTKTRLDLVFCVFWPQKWVL